MLPGGLKISLIILWGSFSWIYGAALNERPIEQTGRLVLVDTSRISIDQDHFSLPLWIRVEKQPARSVKIALISLKNKEGRIYTLKSRVYPDSANIQPGKLGKIFKIIFNPEDVKRLSSGSYRMSLYISSENMPPMITTVPLIVPTHSVFLAAKQRLKWVRENLLDLFWTGLQMAFFVIIISFFVWFSRLAWKGRRSIHVSPIINETGAIGEFDGVASGMDDILMVKLQEINRLIAKEYHWSAASQGAQSQSGPAPETKMQLITGTEGGLNFELQQIGDISIGSFIKIPIGKLITVLLKIFGGIYVTGALQKYGNINKIVLRLEKRRPIFTSGESVSFFESTWPSDTVKCTDLAEGVPQIIDELAFKLTLQLIHDTGTINWLAFKYFLEGKKAFDDYHTNLTRRDRLRDAIECWQKCVNVDKNYAEAHYYLGLAYDYDGKNEDALYRYKKFIELSPEELQADSHLKLAGIYFHRFSDEENALKALQKAEEKNARLPGIYNLRGIIFSRKQEQDLSKEASLYQKAIRLSAPHPDPIYYYNLSVVQYYQKQFDEAQKAGEKALELFGEKRPISLLQTLGWIHYEKGQQLLQKGRSSQADHEFTQSLGYFKQAGLQDPKREGVLFGYGKALLSCNQLEDALTILRRYIRLWPEYYEGYLEIAEILKQLKGSEEQIQIFESLGQLLKDNSLPQILNEFETKIKNLELNSLEKLIYSSTMGAICFYLKKDYDKSLQYYNIFLKNLPDETFLLIPEHLHTYVELSRDIIFNSKKSKDETNKLIKVSIDILKQAIQKYDEKQQYSRAECYELLGDLYKTLNRFHEADIAYEEAVKYFARVGVKKYAANLCIKQAELLISKFYFSDARVLCDYALRMDPVNHEAYHVKGNAYYYDGRDAEAIPEFEKALEINYNLPGAHYNLGLCYYNLGYYEEATRKFETVIKLDEFYTNPDPYPLLVRSLNKLGQYDKAVQILKKAVNLFPTTTKYRNLLGKALEQCNEINEAASVYREALTLKKDDIESMINLASLYTRMGANLEEAFKMSKKALKLTQQARKNNKEKPNETLTASIKATLGWLYFLRNNNEQAVKYLEQSLAYALQDPEHHAHLAMAYARYAASLENPKQKKLFVDKANQQWQTILRMNQDEYWQDYARKEMEALNSNV